jgi:16S rRNA C967 or C1407 C5-methylase (RsmB/RsmF family)
MRRFQPKQPPAAREPVQLGTISRAFLEYYGQILVPSQLSEDQFEQMVSSYKTELPHVFRVSPRSPRVEEELAAHADALRALGASLTELTSFPATFGRIYRLPFDKMTLRKTPPFEAFNSWLQQQTQAGNCHRQEFVSMIPPYFLDVAPPHSVLDMCAAPGSKTGQLLQMATAGLVVANEVDLKRCHDLIHQLQRIGTERCLVTCQAAEVFEIACAFDRVLCDVPCSGDGTIRKDPRAGADWSPKGGLALHERQRAILVRGLELTKVGGLCVYSTCSMNPIEDEAVVNSVAGSFGASVEILDCGPHFPGLKRSPGLTDWAVFGEGLERVDAPDEKYPRTLFPIDVSPSVQFCMRFYPHDLDSGGFFVAVLRKTAEFERVSRAGHARDFPEAPFKPIDADADGEIRRVFGLTPDFKTNQAFFRGEQRVNTVYYFESALAAQIIRDTPHAKLRQVGGGAKIFNFKRFRKDQPELPCPAQEGVRVIAPYVTARKFALAPSEMRQLLEATGDGLPYSQLRRPLADEIRNGPWIAALFAIEQTDFVYSGSACRSTIRLFLRADLVAYELRRLAAAFPEA